MKTRGLKDKTQKELEKILQKKRGKLRHFRFEVSQNKLKNVKEINKVKKDIARTLTIISSNSKSQKLPSSKPSLPEETEGGRRRSNPIKPDKDE